MLIAANFDADRLGVVVRSPDGSYEVLTGNQIGTLSARYILEAYQSKGALSENAAVLKSVISSKLPTIIAEHYGITIFSVLTGSKLIAEKIQQFEGSHSHTFMLGFEEGRGYLVRPFIRDKDAIQALLLLVEVTTYYKKQDKMLYDGLQTTFEAYGYFAEKMILVTMDGQESSAKTSTLAEKFRKEAPTEFAGAEIIQTEDFKELTRTDREGNVEKLTTPLSDVLEYTLEENGWVAIRPLGTGPKIKFYIGVEGSSTEDATEETASYEAIIKKMTEE